MNSANPWKESNKKSLNSEQLQQSILKICRKTAKQHRTLFRRDMIEMIAALVVLFFFGRMLFRVDNWVSQLGAVVVLAGTVNAMYQLNRRRLYKKPLSIDCAVKEYLHSEKEANEFQIGLLKSIAWWYIIPLMIGANLVFVGSIKVILLILGYLIVTLLLGWLVYRINQSAIKKQFLPIQVELEKLLQDLEDVDSCHNQSNQTTE